MANHQTPMAMPQADTGAGAVDTTNANLRNQQLSAVVQALSGGNEDVVAELNNIASAITSDIIGGSTGTTANRALVSKGTGARALQATPVSIDPSTGSINTNGGDLTVDDITADTGAFATGLTLNSVTVATVNQNVGMSFTFKAPEDETVPVYLNFQFAWTITKVTTITEVGTSTVTVKINTTALGGSSNSASTSEQTQTHSSSNSVATSDKVQITFASTSSDCENLCVTIQGTRVLS